MTNPSNGSSSQGRGLGASLQGLMATVLAIFHTRLELLVTELEEEKRRLLATVAWGAVGVLVGCFALAFAAVFITVLFWDSHRLLVVGLMAMTFGLISAWAMHRAKALLRESGQMLAATLAELDADRHALMPAATVPAPADEAEHKP